MLSWGLFFAGISDCRIFHSRFCLFFGEADGPAECAAGVLFRAVDGVFVLRAAIVFHVAHLWAIRDFALAGAGVLGRVVHGNYLRQHPALGKSPGVVADSSGMDGFGIFSE